MAEEHLAYELMMLQATAQELASRDIDNDTIHNALLESFTIHLRTVIDFLWGRKVKPDDVVAADYFSNVREWEEVRPPFPCELLPAKSRANKEVAHLTYARLTIEPDNRPWSYIAMANAALAAFQVFVNNVDRAKVGGLIADG